MKTRPSFYIFSLLGLFLIAQPASTAEWVALFDGESLQGWEQLNGTATYKVTKEGYILGTTKEGSPNSFLCTKEKYGDFELEFEVRVHDKLNSGVQIRSQTKDGNPKGRVNGPQVEIESAPGEAGYVYGEATGRGWLTPKKRLVTHSHMKNNQWNKFLVRARGPRIKTWINDQPIEDLTDAEIYKTHSEGFIALQVHGIKKGTGPYTVAWKNIRLRELKK